MLRANAGGFMRNALWALCPLLLASGCDAECDEPGRIDGEYAAFSNAATDGWSITGFSDDETDEQIVLLDGIFANGWSEWELKYIPGKTDFQLELDGQPYTADYVQNETTCNSFLLSFSGSYTTDVNSLHEFSWEGDLSYFGSHLGGTYSYTDSWTQTLFEEDDAGEEQSTQYSGTITILDGEFRATLQE
jgi:hypothetical protein